MNPVFWNGKRVFVTGHTGFKGSWLCLLLHALGSRVQGYALAPPTTPSLFDAARVDELVDSTLGDVRDLGALCDAVKLAEPDIVLHMAAQSVVLLSYDDPVDTYSTNVLGTVHLLEAVRRSGRPCTVINVTTDKCYENQGWLWGYRETDRLGGRDPYSNSKACSELVGDSYRESFFAPSRWREHGVGLASARAGNVIGGGDWTPRQLIPDAIAAFSRNHPVVLRHPKAVRPWQHVLDCLGGYLTLAEQLHRDVETFSGGWNFGPGENDALPVVEVVERLASYWGLAPAWVQDPVRHNPEEVQLRLDVSKSGALLGWTSRLPIQAAIDWVARWYKDFECGAAARDLCSIQIEAFVSNKNFAASV